MVVAAAAGASRSTRQTGSHHAARARQQGLGAAMLRSPGGEEAAAVALP